MKLLNREKEYLHKNYGVKRLGIFGSMAKTKANKKSDVDMLVEFTKPIGLGFVDFCEFIEKKLGRKVDILTPDGIEGIRVKRLREEMKDEIKKNIIYVR